ncbi:hypothetical protein EJ08DRAFT_666688 [Tothia fuscella]|uniref:DUF6604 domain-containing protein n=1 Tax=Tothia fuscella TaxID=1048955 RepID=A0A9P4NE47_9PEZI|nr:hypothetical protein EJ08DRAFT_666688 [Tothia fuscella]
MPGARSFSNDSSWRPSHLDELYFTYQKKTQKIVDWLDKNANLTPVPFRCENGRSSVRELLDGARTTQAYGISAPESLYFDLLDAISRRQEMTRHYEMWCSNGANETHAFFTQQLREILVILFPVSPPAALRPTKERKDVEPTLDTTSGHGSKDLDLRRFSIPEQHIVLPEVPTHTPAQLPDAGNDIPCAEETDDGEELESSDEPPISDDALFKDWAMARWARECELLMRQLIKHCKSAAQGETSLIFATILTSLAMASINDRFHRTRVPSLEIYLQTNGSLAETLYQRMYRGPDEVDTTSTFIHCESVLPIFRGISQAIGENKVRKAFWYPASPAPTSPVSPKAALLQEPSGPIDGKTASQPFFLMMAGLRLAENEDHDCGNPEKCRDKGSREYINAAYANSLVENECGIYNCQLNCKDRLANDLNVQIQIFRSWIHPMTEHPPAANCRIKFLQFASESESSLSGALTHSLMQHCKSCTEANQNMFAIYTRALKKRLAAKRFDLYHQAPTTAGVQIAHLIDLNGLSASLLCNKQGAVGAVVHLYNVLAQRGYLARIPLLEAVCQVLSGTVFLGDRNAPNCCSVYLRFLGGKLGKSRTSKEPASQKPRHGFREELPGRQFTDPGRWKINKLSVVHRLCTHGSSQFLYSHIPRQEYLKFSGVIVLSSDSLIDLAFRRMVNQGCEREEVSSGKYLLNMLAEMMAPEFLGDYPVARLNWFAIATTCFDIIEAVNKRIFDVDRFIQSSDTHPVQYFVYFVFELLLNFDGRCEQDIWSENTKKQAISAAVEGILSVSKVDDRDKHLFKSM